MVTGDLLDIQEGIIAHQVNCQGAFGAGLAKSIANKYPKCKQAYLDYVNTHPKDILLGDVCLYNVTDKLSIANIFGQFSYGRGKCFTDYKALDKGFATLRQTFPDKPIYAPYKIGCGLAGGDWNIVKNILDKYNIIIVKLPTFN